jgi:hypothetical protein
MSQNIEKVWEETYKNTKGTHAEKTQAANKAVHDANNLLYYEGQGGVLTRQ